MTLLDLFSGIGGFSLAASWAGIETIAFVEIDKFCQKVLDKNFNGKVVTDTETVKDDTRKRRCVETAETTGEGCTPPAFSCNKYIPIYPDITKFDGTAYRGTVDIISGGFPCQPFSCAGKRRGKEDDRYLWHEMLRVISEASPRWIVGENVTGIVNMELDNVLSDLEGIQYETQTLIIPACALNAPHRRDRVWICAHSISGMSTGADCDVNPYAISNTERGAYGGNIGQCVGRRFEQSQCERDEMGSDITDNDCHAPDTADKRLQGYGRECELRKSEKEMQTVREHWVEPWLEVATRLCRVDDGVAEELHKLETSDRVARLMALGNSIVPQIAFQIFKAIVEIDHADRT